MNGRSIDPDTLIIRRVFQPVVDRFEIDPIRTPPALIRMSLSGGAGSLAALVWAAMPLATQGLVPMWALLTSPIMPFISMWLQGWQVKAPPVLSMTPLAAAQRLLWLMMTVMLGYTNLIMPTQATMLVRLACMAFAISWAAGTIAVYLHQCRKPPKRPRREKAASRRLARA